MGKSASQFRNHGNRAGKISTVCVYAGVMVPVYQEAFVNGDYLKLRPQVLGPPTTFLRRSVEVPLCSSEKIPQGSLGGFINGSQMFLRCFLVPVEKFFRRSAGAPQRFLFIRSSSQVCSAEVLRSSKKLLRPS